MNKAFKSILQFLFSLCILTLPFNSLSQQPVKSIYGFVNINGEHLNDVKITPINFKAPTQFTKDGKFMFRGKFIFGKTYLFSLEKSEFESIALIEGHPNQDGYLGTFSMNKVSKSTEESQLFEPFINEESAFKILVFPFDPYSTCKNTDEYCLENIRNRFLKLNQAKEFKVTVKTDNRFNIDFPMTFDSAKAIGSWYNADMVIWGDYEQQCSWDSSLFKIKFITLSNEDQTLFKGTHGENLERIGTFRSIVEEGSLTGDLEDLAYWSMAIRQLQKGNYDAAIMLFRKIKMHPQPEYSSVECLIGWCLILNKAYEEALDAFERALQLDNRNPLVFLCRGILYQQMKKRDKASRDFEFALYLDPSSIESHLQLSFLHKQKGNLLETKKQLDLAIELTNKERESTIQVYQQTMFSSQFAADKFDLRHFMSLGDIFFMSQNYEQSALSFSKAIRFAPKLAEAYLKRGICYDELKRYDEAVNDFNTVIKIDPDDIIIYEYRGGTYQKMKRYSEAIQDFNKVVNRNPSSWLGFNDRGLAFAETNQLKRAIQDFSKGLELDSSQFVLFLNRGISYMRDSSFILAITDFNKAIELWSKNKHDYEKLNMRLKPVRPSFEYFVGKDDDYGIFLAYSNRAKTSLGLGEYQSAISNYDDALRISPNESGILYDKGLAYLYLRDYFNAIKNYDLAINLGSTDSKLYTNKAFALAKLNDYEAAIENLNRALEIDPLNSLAVLNRGLYFSTMEKYDLALQDLTKALDMNPENGQTFKDRGWVFLKLKKHKLAIKDYHKAIELGSDETKALAYVNMGLVYLELNDLEHSLVFSNKAIELDPNQATAYSNRGSVFFQKNNYAEALQDFNKAIELDPNLAQPYINMGSLYFSAFDNHKSALQNLSIGIKLAPDEPKGYHLRAVILYALGRLDEAKSDFQKSISINQDNGMAQGLLALIYAEKNEMGLFYDTMLKAINSKKPFPLKEALQNNFGNIHRFQDEQRFIELLEQSEF